MNFLVPSRRYVLSTVARSWLSQTTNNHNSKASQVQPFTTTSRSVNRGKECSRCPAAHLNSILPAKPLRGRLPERPRHTYKASVCNSPNLSCSRVCLPLFDRARPTAGRPIPVCLHFHPMQYSFAPQMSPSVVSSPCSTPSSAHSSSSFTAKLAQAIGFIVYPHF